MSIAQLNQGTPTLASQVPFYDPTNGQDRRASLSAIGTAIQDLLTPAGGFVTQYAVVAASGFNVAIAPPENGESVFLLLTPSAVFARGTITLPARTDCIDGQQVLVHSTQAVTTLTVDGNGATVNGAPLSLAQFSFFRLVFDVAFGAWFVTGGDLRTAWDEVASVLDFMTRDEILALQAGTGTEDHATAFDLALATGYPVYVPDGPGWEYTFKHTVLVPSDRTIYGEHPTIALGNGVNNHMFRLVDGVDNVEIRGLSLDGNKAANSGGNAIAMGGTGGTNIRLRDNHIRNAAANGIYVAGTTVTGVYVTGNFVTGCGAAGISADSTTTEFAFDGNFAWLNGTHGVGIIGVAQHGSISHNVSWDNGQGTPNADNITGYNASNLDLTIIGNTTRGGLNNGIHVGGSKLRVEGNSAYGALFYGIAVWANTGAGDDVTVTGNQAYGCGLSGFWLKNCNSGAVGNNVARDNTGAGILLDNLTDVTVTGNQCRGNGTGIKVVDTAAYLTITGNSIRGNASHGLWIDSLTFSTIVGNTIRANGGWGIIAGGTEAKNIVKCNIVVDNVSGQINTLAGSDVVGDNIIA